MGMGYFANAAFGVVIGETEDEKEFLYAFGEELEAVTEEDEDLTRPEAIRQAIDNVEEDNPELTHRIREHYGAPPEAFFIYTGDGDDRPGRCATQSDQLVLGLGLYEFRLKAALSEKFVAASGWHTWVEVG